MKVKLRLQRFGSKKKPYYRIVAAANSNKRDGKFLEIVGLYHPIVKEGSQIRLDSEKIFSWLQKGAQPSDQVREILSNNKIWADFKQRQETNRVAKVKKTNAKNKNKSKGTAAYATSTAVAE